MTDENVFRRILTGGSLITIGTILTQLLGFIETVILTRTFDTQVYGAYILGLSTMMTIAILIQLGLGPTVRRYVSEFRTADASPALVGTLILAGGFVVLTGFIAATGTFTTAEVLSRQVFSDPQLSPIFSALAVVLIAKPLLDIASEFAMGEQRVGRMLLFGDVGQRSIRLVTVLLVVWVSASTVALARWTASAYLVFAAIVVGIVILNIYRRYGVTVEFQTRRILAFSLPLVASSIAGRLLSMMDIWMIGYFIGTQAVGIYRPAFSLAAAVPTFYIGLNKMFSPIATEYLSSGRTAELSESLSSFRFWAFVMTVAVFTWTGLFATEFLKLFYGNAYTDGAFVLVGIGAVLTISTGIGPVGTLLEAVEQPRIIARSYALSLVVNVVGNTIAIPLYGIPGAVMATGLSLILLNLTQWFAVRPIIRGGVSRQRYLYIFGAVPPLLGLGFLLDPQGLWLVVLAPLYFTAVIATVFLLVELNETEQEIVEKLLISIRGLR